MVDPPRIHITKNGDRRSSGSKIAQPFTATLWLIVLGMILTFLITPTLYFGNWSNENNDEQGTALPAPFTVNVLDPSRLNELRSLARAQATRVFSVDLSVASGLTRETERLLDRIEESVPLTAEEISTEALESLQRSIEQVRGFTLSTDVLETLVVRGRSEQFREEVKQAYEMLLNRRGVELNNQAETVRDLHREDRLELVFTDGVLSDLPTPEGFSTDLIMDRGDLLTAGMNAIDQQTLLTDSRDKAALRELVGAMVRGNVAADESRSEQLLDEAYEAIKPSAYINRVEAGEMVEPDDLLTRASIDELRPYYRLFNLASNGVIVLFVLIFLISHMRRFRGDWSYTATNVNMVVLPLVLTLGIGRVFLQTMSTDALAPLFFPAGALGMLGVILIGPRIGLMVTFTGCLLFGFMTQFDFQAVFIAVVGGSAAVTALYTLRRRRDIMMAGVVAGVANALAILVVRFTENPAMFDFDGWQESILHMTLGLANGALGCTMITLISLVVFEYAFRVTTDLNLIELTSLKTPLMQEMEEKTPGTYQHTLNVTKLAEGAAMAIGANYLLVRAGAHYHDIGKMVKPKYFTENQATAEERRVHQKLVPSLSALIIKEHVKKGIELARLHRLPEKVIDFIPQHHGTSLIKYFHNEAQRRFAAGETSDPVREDDYRYPGPNPQYVETAILMLADSVEATATAKLTAKVVNPDDVERLVRDTIREKFNDGQLDECNLTLSDLNRIRESFVHTLMARYHQRIDYPAAPPVAATRGA